MSHQPLALKYRPSTFGEVVGQDHVTRTLGNALDRSRVAKAYLFAGPRGSGKTSTARILAKALNCDRGVTGEPCGACANCRSIAAGQSLDVIEIDAASNRGIDDIKELRETVKYAAAQGRTKVYIVDEVHQLSKDAFNAFLKTLEEPPRGVVFVLATTEPHKILPTILSRCQRFDFRPIPLPEVRERLRSIADRESIRLEDAAEFAIAKKADGSLRDALSLLDQLVAFGGEAVDLDALRRLIGIPDEERYLELGRLLAAGDPAGVLGFVRDLRGAGYDLEEFYAGFLEHLRDCLLFAVGDGPRLATVPERYHEDYRRLAATLRVEDLLRMLTLATAEETAFRRSSRPELVLEVLLVRLALLDRAVDIDAALAALAGGGGGGGPAAPASARPASGSGSSAASKSAVGGSDTTVVGSGAADRAAEGEGDGPLTLELLTRAWPEVLDRVHADRPTIAALLQGVEPTGCTGGEVRLTAPLDAEFRLEQLGRRGTLDPLAEVLKGRWGFEGAIRVEGAERPVDARSPVGPADREREPRDPEGRLGGDPLLRQAVELFDASIVRVQRSSPA